MSGRGESRRRRGGCGTLDLEYSGGDVVVAGSTERIMRLLVAICTLSTLHFFLVSYTFSSGADGGCGLVQAWHPLTGKGGGEIKVQEKVPGGGGRGGPLGIRGREEQ